MHLVGIDFDNCKYIFTESNQEIGTNIASYARGIQITSATTQIEQAIGPSENWYLHVLATDKAGNKVERISENSVKIESTAEFHYTGGVQTADLIPGKYKLECWGAQGGSVEGRTNYNRAYGGYSVGTINLNTSTNLFVYVGGKGNSFQNGAVTVVNGNGYNGGGSTSTQSNTQFYGSGGGGATHIATEQGLLSELIDYKDSISENISKEILIVAGGGGGSSTSSNSVNNSTTDGEGGSGGGYIGSNGTTTNASTQVRNPGTGGTQLSGGESYATITASTYTSAIQEATFGLGANPQTTYAGYMRVAGGGGYFGGGGGVHSGGGRRLRLHRKSIPYRKTYGRI